jgi:uncharacterized Zn finger protein
MSWKSFGPRPTVAAKRARADREIARRTRLGEVLSPVVSDGVKLGRTFWGRAWCDRVTRFCDRASRLPSGKALVRHRGVIDLNISPGLVQGLVIGQSVYTVAVRIDPVRPDAWDRIKQEAGGQLNAVIELLRGGAIPPLLMAAVTDPTCGLLPTLSEVHKTCTCYDWADVCAHTAAVLYAVGVRLDEHPDLLFKLRGVDEADLLAAATSSPPSTDATRNRRTIAAADVGAVFGIEMADPADDAST